MSLCKYKNELTFVFNFHGRIHRCHVLITTSPCSTAHELTSIRLLVSTSHGGADGVMQSLAKCHG